MLKYNKDLKKYARKLRKNMTEAEELLWFHLRRKQLINVQFYRQRVIGSYIVDFYAPVVKLVIEVDGSQHKEEQCYQYDKQRTKYLEEKGMVVLRFDNLQVLQSIEAVLQVILRVLVSLKNPQSY